MTDICEAVARDDVAKIAGDLTDSQRAALIDVEITPYHPFIPSYNVKISMGKCSHDDREQFKTLGLMTLPILVGSRFGRGSYYGEIHPLGLAVRAYIRQIPPKSNS